MDCAAPHPAPVLPAVTRRHRHHPNGLGWTLSASVAVNPNTNLIYVANYVSDNVSVIDGASNTVVATVAVGSGPYA